MLPERKSKRLLREREPIKNTWTSRRERKKRLKNMSAKFKLNLDAKEKLKEPQKT